MYTWRTGAGVVHSGGGKGSQEIIARFPAGAGICLFRLVQTGPGAHTADYAVGTESKAAVA